MEKTELEWFNEIIADVASGGTTIFCETLASALHRFDTMIKFLSDDSIVLESPQGHRILVSFNYRENDGFDCLLTLVNYAGNTDVIRNEFSRFGHMIEYIEQVLS